MRSLQMQSKNFEEWLSWEFMNDEPMVQDDDIPDAFDAWLEQLTSEDLEVLASRYGEDVAKRDLAVFKFDNGIV